MQKHWTGAPPPPPPPGGGGGGGWTVLQTLAIPDTKQRPEGVLYNESWLLYWWIENKLILYYGGRFARNFRPVEDLKSEKYVLGLWHVWLGSWCRERIKKLVVDVKSSQVYKINLVFGTAFHSRQNSLRQTHFQAKTSRFLCESCYGPQTFMSVIPIKYVWKSNEFCKFKI